MEFGQDGKEPSVDFSAAWNLPYAYALIRESVHHFMKQQDDYSPEYPYDEFTRIVTTTGMVEDAAKTGRKIEVRYDWESLDESNIILHSAEGYVVETEAIVNGSTPAFVMKTEDVDGEKMMVFEYSRVFWVCTAE